MKLASCKKQCRVSLKKSSSLYVLCYSPDQMQRDSFADFGFKDNEYRILHGILAVYPWRIYERALLDVCIAFDLIFCTPLCYEIHGVTTQRSGVLFQVWWLFNLAQLTGKV